MSQKKADDKKPTVDNGVHFRFVPDLTEESTPWTQVHFGYDFSGGKIVFVDDPAIIRKLRGNRFFGEVDSRGALLPGQIVNSLTGPSAAQPKKNFPRIRHDRMEDNDPDNSRELIRGGTV